MAERFYDCICGRFATINMFAWIHGDQKIECLCGRVLNVKDSFFGFSLNTARYAWIRFMQKEYLIEYIKQKRRAYYNHFFSIKGRHND